MAVDLFDLELAGVIVAAAVVFGGIHLESLSHLSFFFADLADFGDLIHWEVFGDVDGPDGHCHDSVVVVVGPVGLGVGVVGVGVVGVGVVGVVVFLAFKTTLFGQDKFGGLLALYFGVAGKSVVAFL